LYRTAKRRPVVHQEVFGMNDGDILELIKSRRSIRSFLNKEVPNELVMKVLEAGRWAPSASNNQPWRFIVVNTTGLRDRIADMAEVFSMNGFVKRTPVIIVLYTEEFHKWVDLDCGMASQNIMLEAYSLGLGTCFIGGYREKEIKELLNLPLKARILGLIVLGYPDEKPEPRKRYLLNEISSFGSYNRLIAKNKFSKRIKMIIGSKFFKKL